MRVLVWLLGVSLAAGAAVCAYLSLSPVPITDSPPEEDPVGCVVVGLVVVVVVAVVSWLSWQRPLAWAFASLVGRSIATANARGITITRIWARRLI